MEQELENIFNLSPDMIRSNLKKVVVHEKISV